MGISFLQYVNEIRNGEIISYTITPEQFGLKSCELSELIGGTPKENAEITRRILTGEETGPKRDVILMNAGHEPLSWHRRHHPCRRY